MKNSGRSLYLAAPLYGNMLHYGFHVSICQLMALASQRHVHFGMKYIGCDSLVPRARNRLVSSFLRSDMTDLLFVDSDITFRAEDALSLLSLPQPIVGGIYPRKQLDWERIRRASLIGVPASQLPHYGFIPVMNWPASGDYSLSEPIEVRHLGTGFLRIRREVFSTMISQLGDRITFDYSHEEAEHGQTGYDFFPTGPDVRYPLGSGGRQYLSEDWGFCELARQCGFKLYASPSISLTHSGYADYTGSLDIMDAAIEEALAAADPKEDDLAKIP